MTKARSSAESYLFACALVGLAMLVRLPAWNVLGAENPWITFIPAVAITALRRGLWPGVFATAVSTLLVVYLLNVPENTLRLTRMVDVIALLYFVGFGILLSWLSERVIRAANAADAERRLNRQTLASIGDGVITTDARGCVTFLNAVAEDLTAWKAAEADGQPIENIFHIRNEETNAPVEQPVRQVLTRGQVVGLANHTELLARDGRRIPIEDSGAPIRDRDGTLLGTVLVFRDVSQRRENEKRTAATERRLHQLAQSNVIGILFGDIYGHILDANDELLRIIGRSREEMERGDLRWTDITPADHLPADEKALEEARERGACTPYEKEFARPDGSRVPVMVGYVLLEPERVEEVAFIMDLTSRRTAEQALQRINEDLEQFTYGVSHDLKEPLRAVSSYSALLARRYRGRLDQQADEYIRFIEDGIERMRNLVEALLEYSRLGRFTSANAMPVSAEAALCDALQSLTLAIRESSAEITADELPVVLADQVHLSQLFQNLIGNSIKYAGVPAPRIHVSAASSEEGFVFSVRDNGVGIPPEHHERVFGAFQRLHGREFPGTGLGLATCRRIVERYGGKIWVESDGSGAGCTFCFTLTSPGRVEPAV